MIITLYNIYHTSITYYNNYIKHTTIHTITLYNIAYPDSSGSGGLAWWRPTRFGSCLIIIIIIITIYVCVCMYTYIYIYIYMLYIWHIYAHTVYVCTYVCTYVRMHVCMYACMHVCMYACNHVLHLSLSMCIYIYIYIKQTSVLISIGN